MRRSTGEWIFRRTPMQISKAYRRENEEFASPRRRKRRRPIVRRRASKAGLKQGGRALPVRIVRLFSEKEKGGNNAPGGVFFSGKPVDNFG